MAKRVDIVADLVIDEHALDREWVQQPSLYYHYAAELADAQRDYAAAKAAVDVVRADLDSEMRRSPEAYGLAKVTEAALAAALPSQPEVKAAIAEMAEARHRVDILQAAVAALEHRKRALEKLVALRLADYFSSPTAPEAAREDVREMEQRARRPRPKRRASDDDFDTDENPLQGRDDD